MDWLNNANTIASLILAMIGIGGYAYGVMTYLKNKALPAQQTNPPSQPDRTAVHQSSMPYRAFTPLEWAAFFGQGVVDTSDFIIDFCFQKAELDLDEVSPIGRLGGCLLLCLLGGAVGLFVLGGIISLLFTGLGIPNGGNAANALGLILILMILSLVYVYHVGLRAEQKRQQQDQTAQKQQQIRQSLQR